MFHKSTIIIVFLLSLMVSCDTAPESVQTEEPTATLRVQPTGDAIQVGVLAIRSAEAANAQYGGIIAYLEQQLAKPFVLVPVTQDSQFELVASGELHFTFNNPLSAVQIQRLYNTEFLATISRINSGTLFGGLIIVRADSPIESVEDLRGTNVTCVDQDSAAAGCMFQIFHLKEIGIDPFTDFANFTETPSQDNVVLGVLNGTYDAGFIRTGQLERMIAEGTILSLGDIRIIDQAEDDYFFPHTTILYPEWPFAAVAGTDPELVTEVRDALLNMPADHPALTKIGATGFVEDVDYGQLHNLIEVLQLRSWDSGE